MTRDYGREQIVSKNKPITEQFRYDVRYNMNRRKVNGNPIDKKDACLREIQAGSILLKNATKWNLTEKEIEDTKTLIEIYTNKLNKLGEDL